MDIVEASEVVRTFGRRRAVDGVTFRLAAGDCLALFGPNGAGKTTLLRILGGLIAPTSGECTVAGLPIRTGATVRARIGLISHSSMLYSALSARENVQFSASMYGLRDVRAASDAALSLMRVLDRAETPVRLLSRGLQQRVSIARSIVHAPQLLLCDEPYTGLDEVGSVALTRALAEHRERGAALLMVTHNLGEGLALATHTAIMQRGKFVRYEQSTSNHAEYASEYREMVTSDA